MGGTLTTFYKTNSSPIPYYASIFSIYNIYYIHILYTKYKIQNTKYKIQFSKYIHKYKYNYTNTFWNKLDLKNIFIL